MFVVLLPLYAVDFIGQGQPWFCKFICPAGTLTAGIPLVLSLPGRVSLMAPWGQAPLQSPQRIQSGLLGDFHTGISSLQARWQAPQEVHFSSFLHFAGHLVKTRGVFPQGHRKCQSAVPYASLTYPARGRTPPLPCHLRIEELDRLFKRIYEDNANGKLSDSRFQMLSNDYEQEQEELRS